MLKRNFQSKQNRLSPRTYWADYRIFKLVGFPVVGSFTHMRH